MKAIALSVLLLTFTAGAFPQGAVARYVSYGVPIPLADLVTGADRIFLGKVLSTRVVTERVMDVEEAIREVEFEILESFRGPQKEGDRLLLRQFLRHASRPLSTGEQVVWFLAPDTLDGLSVPLGLASGDFRILSEGAMNGNSNRGLWSPHDPFWASRECSRDRFLDFLYVEEIQGQELLTLLRWVDSPYRTSKPLPPVLLRALITACLAPGA